MMHQSPSDIAPDAFCCRLDRFEFDQDPDTKFAGFRIDDLTPCLKVAGHDLWLFSF